MAHVAIAMERARDFPSIEGTAEAEPVTLGGCYGGLEIEDKDDADSLVHTFIKSLAETEADRPCAEVADKAADMISEVTLLLPTTQPSKVLGLRTLPQGAMTASDYMSTHVVELDLHGTDLATSLDQSMAPPPEAVDVADEILVATARAKHGDLAVLNALARSERVDESVFPVL